MLLGQQQAPGGRCILARQVPELRFVSWKSRLTLGLATYSRQIASTAA
jgi:hypothetical protein